MEKGKENEGLQGEVGDLMGVENDDNETMQFICVDMTRAAVLHRSLKWAGYKQVNFA